MSFKKIVPLPKPKKKPLPKPPKGHGHGHCHGTKPPRKPLPVRGER
ncbi:hypothetical protein ACFW1M_00740 [Streptomyces inhibens]